MFILGDCSALGKWFKKHFLTIIILAVMLVGIGLLAYPSVANYWNQFHQTRAIMAYTETVSDLSQNDYNRILKAAKEYNEKLGETGIVWKMTKAQKAEYNKQLAVDKSGIMGYVSIPKFHIKLPVYHGTNEDILQMAIGHLEQTSLPVGGESSHCEVSGHRGLPSARLFTDLDKMKEGDTWTMNVLNETLTYECDQIRIVTPDDLSNLQIAKGKDYCTLITCTPYGVNTHRLLVRGHRIPNADGDANLTADAIRIEPIYIAPFLAIPILIILLIMLIISTRKAKRINPAKQTEDYLNSKGL